MDKLFIIDGNSLLNRAFYALPPLTNSDGVYCNAVFGFVNCLIKLINENKPQYLVVAFDYARKTFRNEIFEGYKGTRKETLPELRQQFPIIKEMLHEMNIFTVEQQGIEADDIIGTICKKSDCDNYIITGDRDALQLVDDKTRVWMMHKGITDIKEITKDNIKSIYGYTEKQVIDYKALAGDSSDNIPGVAGIGEKTALNLLEKYGSVENVYKNIEEITGKLKEKLLSGKESCEISYKLATIKTDCNIDVNLKRFIYDFPFNIKVKSLFEKYEFKSLLKRENIFINADNNDEEIKNDVEFTKINIDELKNSLLNFNSNFCSIQFGATLRISTNKINLEIDPLEYINIDFNECIKLALNDIFADEKVLKIFNDCKEFMKKSNCDNINNYYDLSVAQYLINGGRRADDFEDVAQFYNIYINQLTKLDEMDMKELYFKVELPLIKVLYDMEKTGFNIDKVALNDLYNSYSIQLKELEDSILEYSEDKNININSPKQIGEYLFNTLKITDKGNKKHSTKESSLLDIIDEHPVIEKILKYRKISKVFSTYIEPYRKLTENTSLIHTIFNQTQTSTGRLSSSEPNLQNIPIRNDEHKNLRKIFVSRFDGGFIMSADYNQIELRLLANFSDDESLINDYKRGKDIHSVTASQIFDVNLDDVTASQRRTAKAVNFGIIYGISGFGLSKNVDISVADAFKYINMYFVKYPKVKQYLDGLIDFAKLNGYSRTLFNRIRNIPELKSSNGLQRQLGERVAMNMPLQGSASDLIKLAMIKVQQKLIEINLNSKLILQIHDELVVDVFPGEEEIVKKILTSEMESVYNFKVPLLVDVNYGKTYLDCK